MQIQLEDLEDQRRAIEQIVEYKNDPGNGNTRTQLAFAERTSEWSWLHP